MASMNCNYKCFLFRGSCIFKYFGVGFELYNRIRNFIFIMQMHRKGQEEAEEMLKMWFKSIREEGIVLFVLSGLQEKHGRRRER